MAFWIHSAAARHPDRVAVEGPERSLTYRELADEAVRVAGGLRGCDGPVAVALPPGEAWAIALHGCLLAGLPVQPVDLRLSDGEQAARRRGAGFLIDGSSPSRGIGMPMHAGEIGMPMYAGEASERVVAVMHTSGTTSEPKQIHLSYGNFMASALGSAVALGLDVEERWLCPMPLTHVGGLSILVRSAIYATTAVLHERFSVDTVLEQLMSPERRITMVSLVPTMLARLLDAGLESPPTLRWALLGGGPTPGALLDRARAAAVPVAPTYGMTEACSQIATFGFPLPGVEVRTTSEEILVRGPIVAPGALGPDGWLHTGDLGRFDAGGRLAIVGRKSDTIVTGGENVAPAEVEAVLVAHPAVADAAVFAREDPEWGEAVVARVVLSQGASVSGDVLQAFCRERLAGFKVPKAVEFAPELPRTVSGKLLRRELG